MKRVQFVVLFVASLLLVGCISGDGKTKVKVKEVNASGISVPVNQVLTPAGIQVELTGARPQVIAVSPDCQLLVSTAKNELVVLNPQTGKILQRVALPRDEIKTSKTTVVSTEIVHPDLTGQASYNGLVFSPDGKRIYLSNVQGDIKVFAVDADHKVRALHSIKIPRPPHAKRYEIPAGLAVSGDGQRLYVAGNLSDRLLEIDIATGKTLRMIPVGALPYDVVLVGEKLFVSNWGGRQFTGQGTSGPAGQGTTVRVDPVRFIANDGSVSVIDIQTGKVAKEIVTGARATGLAVSPDRRYVAVADVGSDEVSVIDVGSLEVVETIPLRWQPKDLFGASPDALVFDDSGKRLYVCNGTQNAIAVVDFNPGKSHLVGLIPTGWYPGAIDFDQKHSKLCVANVKGIGSGQDAKPGEKVELNSHQWRGTIELIDKPSERRLAKYTQAVLENYGHAAMEAAMLPPRDGVAAKPVPERAGEPSVFKHVLYIIKENRTYDQVLGDMKEGNGDAHLCIFGEKITPNQHKLCRDFVLMDNMRCSGAVSADGHQWTDSAFATDYIEKSFAGFPRSYPYYGDDAMAYSPAGFLWDNALAHGKTFRDYGEFTRDETFWVNDRKHRDAPHFLDCYQDFIKGTGRIILSSHATVPSLQPYLCTNTTGFKLNVPDVWRASVFISEFKQFERNDSLPELMIMLLPSDHTMGTKAKSPTPAAKVADNDFALGQIVDAVSHSKYWKDTCIFAIEDDPQMGFDHVSSYRTTAYVASAYTKRHAVVHTAYNQTGLVRTIELIFGLPPMNQFDATATPMFDCFMDQPDLAPFEHVRNNIPLDQMNPEPRAINDAVQRKYAIASGKLPLEDADECPEDLFNRILWNAQRGNEPYPDWAVSVSKKSLRD